MAEYKFPTEMVELPSKGHFYADGHPLSSGKVEVKYMTAKEEDILTSQNLIKQGTVIDKLLESLIVDKSIKLDDMLIGDKNALMVGTRVLGYGKDYVVKITDPDTNLDVEHSFDLTNLKSKTIDDEVFAKGNKFEFTCPKSKAKLEFKILTSGDENEITKQVKSFAKISKLTGVSNELTTRLKYQIISVDGDTKQSLINDFVDNRFLSLDTKEFRKYINSITPDIIFEQEYESQIGDTHTVAVPIGIGFFWPDA